VSVAGRIATVARAARNVPGSGPDRNGAVQEPQHREVRIRALGVSLVAVAAVAASLILTRQQRPERGETRVPPAVGEDLSSLQQLDAIRAAGF
jgi:hypothetical protein